MVELPQSLSIVEAQLTIPAFVVFAILSVSKNLKALVFHVKLLSSLISNYYIDSPLTLF